MKCDFIDGEKTFKDPLQKSYAAGLAEGEKRAMEKMESLGEWWQGANDSNADCSLMGADHVDEDEAAEYMSRPLRKVRLFAIPLEEKEKEVKQ